MSRRSGGTKVPAVASETTRSPMRITPPVGDSRPESIRRVVVFPHPDGPRIAVNDPSGISRSRCSTAARPFEYRFSTSVSSRAGIGASDRSDVDLSQSTEEQVARKGEDDDDQGHAVRELDVP